MACPERQICLFLLATAVSLGFGLFDVMTTAIETRLGSREIEMAHHSVSSHTQNRKEDNNGILTCRWVFCWVPGTRRRDRWRHRAMASSYHKVKTLNHLQLLAIRPRKLSHDQDKQDDTN